MPNDGLERQQKLIRSTGVGNLSPTRGKYLGRVGNHFLTNNSIQASTISLRTELSVSVRQKIDPDLLKDGLERQQKLIRSTGVGNLSLTRVKYLDGVGNHFLTNNSIQASTISLRTELSESIRQRIDPDLLKDGLERQQKLIRSTGVGNLSPTREKYLDGVGNHFLTNYSIQASTISLRTELSVSVRQKIDPNMPNDGLERQRISIRSTGVGNSSPTRVKYLDGVGNHFLTNNSIQASTLSLRIESSVSIRQKIDPDLLKDGLERQQKSIRSTGVGNLSLTRGKYLDGVGNHFLTNNSIQASTISLRTE
ncbi:hypothetical protein IV203_028136 [Nitzschia inconspicua]|uniref:Uncharacterized protein n=1 Tax=Nitzschia inconspicua TaxID=303405 RepID=A0A9K3Q4S8_9STRA|nr:hypothetical protein IV203_028132 [Nitzschia inconspicua]KAG7370390.1 hypothetical protein IV203_028136 [Nitzschia inconspicua]